MHKLETSFERCSLEILRSTPKTIRFGCSCSTEPLRNLRIDSRVFYQLRSPRIAISTIETKKTSRFRKLLSCAPLPQLRTPSPLAYSCSPLSPLRVPFVDSINPGLSMSHTESVSARSFTSFFKPLMPTINSCQLGPLYLLCSWIVNLYLVRALVP